MQKVMYVSFHRFPTKDEKGNVVGEKEVYRTRVKIVVKGEEEKGKQERYLTVRYAKNIFPPKYNHEVIFDNQVSWERDKHSMVKIPKVWEIVTKNGKAYYPCIWVNAALELKKANRDTNPTELL